MREHHILYIIVAGWEFGGLIFIFWGLHIQYRDPWNALKLSINRQNTKSIYTQWESLFSEEIKPKKLFFGPKSYGTKKGGCLVFKMFNFWTFLTFYFLFFIFFFIFGHFEIHFLTFWDPPWRFSDRHLKICIKSLQEHHILYIIVAGASSSCSSIEFL